MLTVALLAMIVPTAVVVMVPWRPLWIVLLVGVVLHTAGFMYLSESFTAADPGPAGLFIMAMFELPFVTAGATLMVRTVWRAGRGRDTRLILPGFRGRPD